MSTLRKQTWDVKVETVKYEEKEEVPRDAEESKKKKKEKVPEDGIFW